MSIFSTGVLALSLSADAFAVAISKGIVLNKPRLTYALRVGAVFGTIEGITPLLGWTVGQYASSFIKDIDHWVAFLILSAIGMKFIYESFQPIGNEKPIRTRNIGLTILAALATSIDAFAVGLSWAFIRYNIIMASVFIGLTSFIMVTIGIMCGRYIGTKMGRYAERLGGGALILIGTKILFEHLHIL